MTCSDGDPYFFAPQRKCHRGNRILRDVQIIGEIVDKWLTCGQYDYKEHRCSLAAEVEKSYVVFKRCESVIDDLCAQIDANCATHPGEDRYGHSLSPQ